MSQIRIKVPENAARDEIIEIKAMIAHAMESGYRRDNRGEAIPRNIITRFECEYDGQTVFRADFGPGVSANPILTFYLRARNSGPITFAWTEQGGEIFTDTRDIVVR
ncbi:thiosulfate oxidation carrier complex protein SoxZ [Fretibacter rubidus]|uniref:thiosulfate oxidation carrier complex protein SoxZ n=1 Tax=Fretibacter rubidus TaxID=570162 RepID=UPI00352B4BAA